MGLANRARVARDGHEQAAPVKKKPTTALAVGSTSIERKERAAIALKPYPSDLGAGVMPDEGTVGGFVDAIAKLRGAQRLAGLAAHVGAFVLAERLLRPGRRRRRS